MLSPLGDLFGPLNRLVKKTRDYNEAKESFQKIKKEGGNPQSLDIAQDKMDSSRNDVEQALTNVLGGYYNGANSRDGIVKTLESNVKVSNASPFKAQAGYISPELAKNIESNAAIVSDEDFKKMFRYSGDNTKVLKRNINNLKNLRKAMAEETGEEWEYRNIKDQVEDPNNIEELRTIQEQLLGGIAKKADVYNGDGVGIVGDINRYPFSADQGLVGIRLRVASGDLAKEFNGKFETTAAVAKRLNLDWDGDTSYIKFSSMMAENNDTFRDRYKALQKYDAYEQDVTKTLQMLEDKENSGAQEVSNSKNQEALKRAFGTVGELDNFVTSMLSKKNFEAVGTISNLAQGARLGMNYSPENTSDFINSKIVSEFFEPLEQDAISAKKVLERLKISGTDLNEKTSTEIKDIIKGYVDNGDVTQYIPQTIEDLRSLQRIDFSKETQAKDIISGIVDRAEKNGLLSASKPSRQSQILQAQIEAIARSKTSNEGEYEEFLKKHGFFDSRITKYDGDFAVDNEDNWGLIGKDVYKNALYVMGKTPDGRNAYKKGIDNLYKNKGSYKKDSDAIQDQMIRDFNYKYKEKGYYAYTSKGGQSGSVFGQSSEGDNGEISGFGKDAPEAISAGTVVVNASVANVNAKTSGFTDGKQTSGKVFDRQTSGGNKEQTSRDNKAGFARLDTSVNNETGKRNHTYYDKNNKLIKGMGASSIASALFGRDYGNYVDLPESSEFSAEGDYAHKQLEYLNSLKKSLLDLGGFSEEEIQGIKDSNNIENLRKILKNSEVSDANKSDLNKMFSYYDDEVVNLEKGWRDSGFDDDSIFEIKEKGAKMAEAMAQIEQGFLDEGKEKIASELSMYKNYNGQEVRATSDAIYYDSESNTFTVGDYKSGIYHPGQANVQTTIGIDMFKDIFGQFVNFAKGSGSEDVNQQVEYAKKKLFDLFDSQMPEDQKTAISNAFASAYIKSGGDLNKAAFDNMVITSNGKSDGTAEKHSMNPIKSSRLEQLLEMANNGEMLSESEQKIIDKATEMGKTPVKISKLSYNWEQVLKNQQAIWKNEERAEKAINRAINPMTDKDAASLYADEAKKIMATNDWIRENQGQYYHYDKSRVGDSGESWRGASIYQQVGGQSVEIELTDKQRQKLYNDMQPHQNKHDANMSNIQAYVPEQKRDFLGSVFNEFKSSVAYLTKTSLIYGLIGKVKSTISGLIQTIQSLDKAIVNLQIVTRSTREDLSGALSGYSEIAQEMGVATSTVLSASEDWLRAGYSIEEANTLIRDSLKLSVLGMMDASEATTSLISVMKGWKLSSGEMDSVVDNVTALDSSFATTASDIMTAMSKANVSAGMAGLDLDDFEAYVTTILDTSQISAETVGTSLKSLIARYGNVKAGKFISSYDSGVDEDDLAPLNDVETVLNSEKVGVSTRDSAYKFRDLDEVLEEIAGKWKTYDKVTQNAISTAMGGTRQREALNVLFENWDSVEKAKGVIENSDGTADEKYMAYANSIEAAKEGFAESIQSQIISNENLTRIMTQIYNVGADLVRSLKVIVPLLVGMTVLNKIGGSGFNGLGIHQNIRNIGQKAIYGAQAGFMRLDSLRRGLKSVPEEKIYDSPGFLLSDIYDSQSKRQMPFIDSSLDKISGRFIGKFDSNGRQYTGKDFASAKSFILNDLGASGLRGLYTGNNLNYIKEIPKILENVTFADNGAMVTTIENRKYREMAKSLRDSGIDLDMMKQISRFNPEILSQIIADPAVAASLGDIRFGNLSENAMEYFNKYALDKDGKISKDMWTKSGKLKNPYKRAKKVTQEEGAIKEEDPRLQQYIAYENLFADEKKQLENSKMKQARKAKWDKAASGMFYASMATQVVTSAVNNGKTTSQAVQGMTSNTKAGQTAGALAESAATLGPMIGMAVGGPVGAAVGAATGVLIPVISAIGDALITTDAEVKQIRSDMNQKLTELKDSQEAIDKAEENETKLKRYAKGVDQSTGENISLTSEEYTDYQSILEEISQRVNGIQVLTDANGNKVLKANGSILDLNESFDKLSEAIKTEAFHTSDQIYKDWDYKGTSDVVRKGLDNELSEWTGIDPRTDTDLLKTAQKVEKKETWGNFFGIFKQTWDAILSDNEKAKLEDELAKREEEGGDSRVSKKTYLTYLNNKEGVSNQEVDEWIDQNLSGALAQADADESLMLQAAASATEDGAWQKLNTQTQDQILGMFGQIYQAQNAGQILDDGIWDGADKQKKLGGSIQALTTWAANDTEGAQTMAYLQTHDYTDNNYKENLERAIEVATKGLDDKQKATIEQSMMEDAGYVKANGRVEKNNSLGINTKKGSVSKTEYITKAEDYALRTSGKVSTAGKSLGNIQAKDLTEDQWKALYGNINLATANDLQDKTSILNFITKQSISGTSTGSQLYSGLKSFLESKSGGKFSSNEDFAKYIFSEKGQEAIKDNKSYEKMAEHALSLGFDIKTSKEDLQSYLDKMDLVGNINLRFQTDESLQDIESNFSNLDKILSDIGDDGKLSLENLGTLIDKYGDSVIDVLDDSDKLKERIEELQGTKFDNVTASLTKTFGDSEKMLDKYLNGDGKLTIKNSDGSVIDTVDFDKQVQAGDDTYNSLQTMGTVNTALTLGENFQKFYPVMGEKYFGKNGNVSGSQYEADVASQFGYDADNLSESDKNSIMMAIIQALQSAGVDTKDINTYEGAMGAYKKNVYGENGSIMYKAYYEAQRANLYDQLEALQTQLAVAEEQAWTEEISRVINKANTAYNNGTISAENYIASLEGVRKSGHATKEQMVELAESIEDARMASKEYWYSLNSIGKGSGADSYRKSLVKAMNNNAKGSDDFVNYANKYVQTFKDAVEYDKLVMETKINEDDYAGKRNYQNKIAQDWINVARGLITVGYSKESPEVLQALQGYEQAMKDKSQTYIDEFSQKESDYQNGYLSGDGYIKAAESLSKMASQVGLTTEEFKELNEKIEDFYENKYNRQLEYGKITGDEYRKGMIEDVLYRNVKGSQDADEIINKIGESFDQDVERLSILQELSKEDYNYKQSIAYLDESFNELVEKGAFYKAFGYADDSLTMLNIYKQMNDKLNEKKEVTSQRLSDLNKFYSQGYISQSDYSNVLEEIAKDENITAETAIEISEAIEDMKAQQYERQLSSGNYDDIWDIVLGYTQDVTANNAIGSEEWYAGIDKIPDFINQELSKQQKAMQFVNPDDYHSIMEANQASYETSMAAISALEQIMVKNPVTGELEPLFTENSDTILSLKEGALQALNNQTEAIQNWGEKLHNDYSNGYISLGQYKTGLDSIYSELQKRVANGEATIEEITAFKNMTQEYYTARFDEYFGYEKVEQGSFEKEIQDYLNSAVYGQQQGASQLQNWDTAQQLYDRYYQTIENQMQLLDDNDYDGRRELLDKKIETITYSELANATHIYGKDSQEAQEVLLKLADALRQEEQFVSDQISQTQSDYEQGYLSMQDAQKQILEIAKDAKFSESKKVADQAVKEWYSDYYLNYAQYDGLSNDEIQQGYLENVLSKNVYQSKGYYDALNNWLSIGERQIQNAERDVQLMSDNDYEGKAQGYDEVIESLKEQYKYVSLLEGEDSDAAKDLMLQIKDTYDKKTELISSQISEISGKYSQGLVSDETYLDTLNKMLKDADLSVEQREEILEAIEDQAAEKIQRDYKLGNLSYSEAADKYAEEVVNKNVKGSQDYWNEVYNWKSIIDQGINDSLQKVKLIDRSTRIGRDETRAIYEEAINQKKDEYAQLRLAGWDKDSPELIALQGEIVDLYDSIASITAESVSEAQTKYSSGETSITEYLEELYSIKDEGVYTTEQLREINKGIQDVYSQMLEYGIEYGTSTYDEYREGYIKDVLSQNKKGSEPWNEAIKIILDSFNKQNSNLQSQLSLYEKDDYLSKENILRQQLENYKEAYIYARAAGYAENSDEILSIKNAMIGVYESIEQITNDMVSELQEDYSIGKISDQDLSNKLTELINTQKLTSEQMEKLRETLETVNLNLLKNKLARGVITNEDYRSELVKGFISQNDTGSESWNKYVDEYLNSFESSINALEAQRKIMGESDTLGQINNLNEQLSLLKDQQVAIEAIARDIAQEQGISQKEAEKALQTNEKYLTNLQKQLDYEKQIAQLKVDQSQSVMDSYVTLSEYAINLLEDEKDAVFEYYDTQIEKLEEVNNQKQKSIELLKLEQELEDAKKEKTRVYQAGVGFTYVQNRTKVKEAEENLQNYYDNQKIEALKNSQDKSNKYFTELINNWQDIKELIGKVESTTNAQKAVNTLINNQILSGDSNIGDALNTIMANTIWSEEKPVNSKVTNLYGIQQALDGTGGIKSKIIGLGDAFDSYADQYTKESLALQKFEDLGIKADTDNIKGKVDLNDDTVVALAQSLAGYYDESMGTVASAIENVATSLSNLDSSISDLSNKLTSNVNGLPALYDSEKAAEEDIKDVNNKLETGQAGGIKIEGASEDQNSKILDSTAQMKKAIEAATKAITSKDTGLIDRIKKNTDAITNMPSSLSKTLQDALNNAYKSWQTSTGTNNTGNGSSNGSHNITVDTGSLSNNIDKLNKTIGTNDSEGLRKKIIDLTKAINESSPGSTTVTGGGTSKKVIQDAIKGLLGYITYPNYDSWMPGQTVANQDLSQLVNRTIGNYLGYFDNWGERYTRGGSKGKNVYSSQALTNKWLSQWFHDSLQPYVTIWGSRGTIYVADSDVSDWLSLINTNINKVKNAIRAMPAGVTSTKASGMIRNTGWVGDVHYSFVQGVGWVPSKYITYRDGSSYIAIVNAGTPIYGIQGFANGTAFAQGNWGTKTSGKSLVGELGPELLVRNGHYQTIGDKSAEIISYRKGDIIFNADQTAQIMKYGEIIRGRRRGKAFAEGTEKDNKGTPSLLSKIKDLGLQSIDTNAITQTQLAMLRGLSFDSDLAFKMLQTMNNGDLSYINVKGKTIDSNKDTSDQYNFYGDLNLPNVKDPSNFMSELINTASKKFNIVNQKYKR